MLPNIHSDEELARYVSVFEALRECIPDAPLRERLTVFLTVDSANALAVLPRALRALPTGSCLGASCCYRSLLSYSPEVTIDEVQFYRDVAATCSYPNQLALLVAQEVWEKLQQLPSEELGLMLAVRLFQRRGWPAVAISAFLRSSCHFHYSCVC